MSLEVNLLLIDEEHDRVIEASCPAISNGQEPRQWVPDKIVGNWDTLLDLSDRPWDDVNLEELFPNDPVLQRIRFFPGDGDYRYKVYRDGTIADWK